MVVACQIVELRVRHLAVGWEKGHGLSLCWRDFGNTVKTSVSPPAPAACLRPVALPRDIVIGNPCCEAVVVAKHGVAHVFKLAEGDLSSDGNGR